MDTTLTLEMPGASGPRGNGAKRKWNSDDGAEGSVHGVSLELALGCLPSLSATGCVSEASSEVESLSFNPLPKKHALPAKAAPGDDWQLSLSSGASASIITNTSVLHQQSGILDASATVDMPTLVDEGSTSSLRKPIMLSFGTGDAAEQVFYDLSDLAKTDTAIPMSDFVLTNTSSSPTKRSPPTCSSGINKTRRCPGTRTCQFQGCAKGARGASGLCIAHGGGRRCQREGCGKGAEGRTVFCKAHGGGRRCQHLGCTKSAEGRTEYCIAHGGGRRCSHTGCPRAARGKSGLCIKHGGGKRCQRDGCTRSAEGLSGLCISHGGGRRCNIPDCPKGAQGSTMFCKAHGGGKRCTAIGCRKGAEGSTPFCKAHGGGKRCSFEGGGVCPKSVHGGTLFCVAHGGGKRCAQPGCNKSARGRTNHCVRHGGGKRCRMEGCGKSAQGRTEFCKAHGGGTRCCWGHPSSNVGSGDVPCDKFARGRTGLCTSHGTTVDDQRVHGSLGWIGMQNAMLREHDKFNAAAAGDIVGWNGLAALRSHAVALPEGRVHGGGLMAMLASGVALDSENGHVGSSDAAPRKWM